MKLYLNRTCTRQDTTDGVLLSSNGERICDTAEHTPTMLPRGKYRVIVKRHPKYKHRTPWVEIVDVLSNASGFVMHGNGVHAKDFGTTIIVGDHLVPGVVIRSRPYFDKLLKRIETTLLRHKEVILIIS